LRVRSRLIASGTAKPEAFGQTQRVFVEEAAQMLLRAGAVFDDALISGE